MTAPHVTSVLTLELPEPPSQNIMLGYAKQRTRKTFEGGWCRRAIPIVYDNRQKEYDVLCLAAIRKARVRPPPRPWDRWCLVSMHFRLHDLRDWVELAASAKWPIDFLIREGFIANDSPREMERPQAWPTQEISRSDRGLELVIGKL